MKAALKYDQIKLQNNNLVKEMRLEKILHNILGESQQKLHTYHTNFIQLAIRAVHGGAALSLTDLGRNLPKKTSARYAIKRVDRMLGNDALHCSLPLIYRSVTRWLIKDNSSPIIAIDWSSANPNRTYHILRAVVVLENGGRGLTVYEKTFQEKYLNSHKAHLEFLKNLQDVLPENCCPTILTDAGFKCPWFEAVEEFGWNYVGRVRGTNYINERKKTPEKWELISKTMRRASTKQQYLGELLLTKRKQHLCCGYLQRKPTKNRKKITVQGRQDRSHASRTNARRATEPWLLVSNKSAESKNDIKEIFKLYEQRMQIEEAFRDTKSITRGFKLKQARSRSTNRIDILLCIACLAQLIAYIIGLATELSGHRKKYQANSLKKRRLSFIFLGVQVLKEKHIHRQITEKINLAINQINRMVNYA